MGNAESSPTVPADTPVDSVTPTKDESQYTASSSYDAADPKENESRDDDSAANYSKITDDQINVNLAMADLMAYLQVVANNSNNLPVTRRDDPELDRTISSLSAEEYARKSAAFVPADIRMIGATFTRYGRVWDLPTSEVRTG